MKDYASKIELAKTNFIPMLPFVPMPFHDFDKYKTYNNKGIYIKMIKITAILPAQHCSARI